MIFGSILDFNISLAVNKTLISGDFVVLVTDVISISSGMFEVGFAWTFAELAVSVGSPGTFAETILESGFLGIIAAACAIPKNVPKNVPNELEDSKIGGVVTLRREWSNCVLVFYLLGDW